MTAVLHTQPIQLDAPDPHGADPHASPASTGRMGYWGGVLGRIVGGRSSPDGAGLRSDSRTAPIMAGASSTGCYRGGAKGAPAVTYLEGPRVLSCTFCRTHITTHDQIISKVRDWARGRETGRVRRRRARGRGGGGGGY